LDVRRQSSQIPTVFRTGWAGIYLAGTSTVDEIVFGEPGDLILLGARSLEGMNLRVDPFSKALVDAGPAPAGAGCVPVVAGGMMDGW
jgi:hypothetical protein